VRNFNLSKTPAYSYFLNSGSEHERKWHYVSLYYSQPLCSMVSRLVHTKGITSCIKISVAVYRRISSGLDLFDLCMLRDPIAIIRKSKWTERWRWNYLHYSLQINTFIQSASKMTEQISGVSSPHQNKEKISYQYMSANM
jgi:hypothetical protein